MQCVDDREDEEITIRKMKGMNGYYPPVGATYHSCLNYLLTHPSFSILLLLYSFKITINRSIKTHSWAVGQGGDWRPESGEWRVSGE